MAVTTVGVTASGGTRASGAAITVSKPAGSTTGDWHIFVGGFNGNTPTWAIPSGWTTFHQNTANGEPLVVIYGPNDASTSYTFTPTQSGSIDGGWAILTVRGLDATAPVLGISADGADGGGTGTHTAGAVSWTGAASAVSLIVFTWQAGDTTITWGTGWTQEWKFGDGTGANGLTGAFEVTAVASNWTINSGVTSLPSHTYTNTPNIFGEFNQLALKAAAGGTTFNQSLTASSTSTATVAKQAGKTLTSTASISTSTIVKQAQKALTVNSTSTATLAAVRTVLMTLAATSTSAATLTKQAQKALAVGSTSISSLTKLVFKALMAIDTELASIIASATHQLLLSATSTSTASILAVKAAGQVLTATSTSTATIEAHVIQGTAGRPTDLWRQEYSENGSSYSEFSDVFRQMTESNPNPQEDSWLIRLRQFGRRFF